jgi:hypothetical protein
VSQVESYRQPEIDVTANLTPANTDVLNWINQPRSIRVGVYTFYQDAPGLTPRVVYTGRAEGGPVPGPYLGPRADNVLIAATPGEWVHQVPAVRYWGSDFMDAVNRMDKAAVAAQVARYAYGGPVGVPASTASGAIAPTVTLTGPDTVRLDRQSVVAVAEAIVAGARDVAGHVLAGAERSAAGSRSTPGRSY